MENKFEHIDDVIARFLSGEATADDRQLLEDWRAESEENNREFLRFEKLFNVSGELRDGLHVDTDAAWKKVQTSIKSSSQTGKVIDLKPSTKRLSFLRVAATILILAGAGLSIYFLLFPVGGINVQVVALDSVKTSILPDGSSISLNRNSALEYSETHFSKNRVVKLHGEAFFDVVHDDKNPFVVEAGDLKIQDVGTSFNVKAVENSDLVIVSVVSGEVNITTINNESITLHKGEEARYILSKRTIEKSEVVDPNIFSYSNRVFVFDNTELINVIAVLNEVYQNRLTIGDERLNSCRITVTFNDESLEEIVLVIKETLGIDVKEQNQQFIFSGNGCK